MNKTITTGYLLLPLLWVITAQANAQTDAAASALLNKVTQTYEGYKTIQADFTINVQQSQAGNHTESGTLYLEAASGKYYITTEAQDLISDGKSQWTVLKEEREVQVTEVDNTDETISPANIFSFYKKGYKYVSAPDERNGNALLHVVELTPEDSRAPYFKIKLRIQPSSNQIADVTLFDKGGNRYTYMIKNTKTNQQIAADKFAFKSDRYPTMEIVDLR